VHHGIAQHNLYIIWRGRKSALVHHGLLIQYIPYTSIIPIQLLTAGAHFCTEQKSGKFQGVMQATTPIGTLRTSTRRSGVSLYTSGSFLMSIAFCNKYETPMTSPLAASSGFPCSNTRSSANSSTLAENTSDTFCIAAFRSERDLVRQLWKAECAASTAL